MPYGTEEQKRFFLPRILSGEIVFAIGYSEPEAGTDLASLRTKAVREVNGSEGNGTGGNEEQRTGFGGAGAESWRIDGAKTFTSNAQNADWIWLACRTDPAAP